VEESHFQVVWIQETRLVRVICIESFFYCNYVLLIELGSYVKIGIELNGLSTN
jgi:hypothetical protein